jgi:hypothetical protein
MRASTAFVSRRSRIVALAASLLLALCLEITLLNPQPPSLATRAVTGLQLADPGGGGGTNG